MTAIRVHDILPDRVLITRESARLLEDAIAESVTASSAGDPGLSPVSILIDFHGVGGVAPSFIDEMIRVVESVLTRARGNGQQWRLILNSPPNRLSSKFEAIARSHDLSVSEQPNGSWVWTNARDTRK